LSVEKNKNLFLQAFLNSSKIRVVGYIEYYVFLSYTSFLLILLFSFEISDITFFGRVGALVAISCAEFIGLQTTSIGHDMILCSKLPTSVQVNSEKSGTEPNFF
jgi:hypothetical protein